MKRFFSLLVGGLSALAISWACTPQPVSDDDDDSTSGSGNKSGQGGATVTGGGAGIGSGASGGTGPSCTLPLLACSGVCTNVTSDVAHCGSCTTMCPSGSACTNGMCSCAAGAACPNGQSCVNNVCACPTGQTVCASTGLCSAPASCVVAAGGASGAGGAPAGGSAGAGATGGVSPTGGIGATGGVSPTGGVGATAGSGTSGSAGSGATTGNAPPGYWTYKDWHGCAWTGIDTDTTATMRTTITPQDFTTNHAEDAAYCASGSVGNTYESVALLGFNLAQPAEGASCVYDPAAASSAGPPSIAMTGTGLAINFSKKTAATLRVQIQGQNGATDAADRWCYTITDAAGPVFAPFEEFNTECWDNGGAKYAGQPISAVVFLVPGAESTTAYDFCVNGFAAGTSVADAPTGGTTGPLTGTIGGSGSTDLDFQRVKVKVGGHSYIIQNNNWGNPGGSNQTLSYSDNSFKVTQMDGSGSSAPASFPSIYIGANGDTQMGTYSTTSDDKLPKQISAITSVATTFKYTLGSGQMNAAFDIWFAASKPTACYGDAISGFIMLWFHKPSNFMPIGTAGPTVSIAGKDWVVWTGQRGTTGQVTGSCAVSNANAPVVSYVATGDITNWSGDLKPFFTDAAGRGIQSGWWLTDVFGGFEIWNGGTNAAVQEFTAIVAP